MLCRPLATVATFILLLEFVASSCLSVVVKLSNISGVPLSTPSTINELAKVFTTISKELLWNNGFNVSTLFDVASIALAPKSICVPTITKLAVSPITANPRSICNPLACSDEFSVRAVAPNLIFVPTMVAPLDTVISC